MRNSDAVFSSRRYRNWPPASRLDAPLELKVRPFLPEDLNAVLEIQRLSKPITPWRARDFEQLAIDPRGLILVAEFAGAMPPEVLGFANSYRVDAEAELWSIAVAPPRRRQGIARALLEEACRRLSDAGVRKLFLEVRESNHPALELYRSFGFEPYTRRKDYYHNPKEDALVLLRQLRPVRP